MPALRTHQPRSTPQLVPALSISNCGHALHMLQPRSTPFQIGGHAPHMLQPRSTPQLVLPWSNWNQGVLLAAAMRSSRQRLNPDLGAEPLREKEADGIGLRLNLGGKISWPKLVQVGPKEALSLSGSKIVQGWPKLVKVGPSCLDQQVGPSCLAHFVFFGGVFCEIHLGCPDSAPHLALVQVPVVLVDGHPLVRVVGRVLWHGGAMARMASMPHAIPHCRLGSMRAAKSWWHPAWRHWHDRPCRARWRGPCRARHRRWHRA